MNAGQNVTVNSDIVDAVITGRFACRRFTNQAVSKETVANILQVARFAPSGANMQPWKVYIVAGAAKDEISRRLVEAHDEASGNYQSEFRYYGSTIPEPYASRKSEFGRIFYTSLGIEQSDIEARARQTAKNYGFFGAPVGLIFTIDRRLQIGSWLDLGMFVQNVMIAAGARGLQTCPQETFSRYHVVLRRILPIASEEMVVCGMSIGYSDVEGGSAGIRMPKRVLGDFAEFVGFSD